jgi:FkbM family methyltransferase
MITDLNSSGTPVKAWIYGDGGFANLLRKFLVRQNVEIVGIITKKYLKFGEITGGLELYEDNKYPVYIGVFNHKDSPLEILEYLEKINVVEIFSPAQVCLKFPETEFDKYFLSTKLNKFHKDYDLNYVNSNLSDQISKDIFKGFISYQKTGDLRKLIRTAKSDIQYLGVTLPTPYKESWMSVKNCWLDLGSFDGDTLRAIENSGRNMENDQYICIEPDINNFQKLQKSTNSMKSNFSLINIAISDKQGVAKFAHEGALSSRMQIDDLRSILTSEVEVKTIDQVCVELSPTHIKMDIEGAEFDALIGGERTLKKFQPKLAISLYHRPRDIVEIPKYLMSLLPGYKWFVRCYGEHGYDTILYGIPEKF